MRSIAFTTTDKDSSVFIMHFPPNEFTSPMSWEPATYKSEPLPVKVKDDGESSGSDNEQLSDLTDDNEYETASDGEYELN